MTGLLWWLWYKCVIRVFSHLNHSITGTCHLCWRCWQFRTVSRFACGSNPLSSRCYPEDRGGVRVPTGSLVYSGKLKSSDWSDSGAILCTQSYWATTFLTEKRCARLHFTSPSLPTFRRTPTPLWAPPRGVRTSRGRAEAKKWSELLGQTFLTTNFRQLSCLRRDCSYL